MNNMSESTACKWCGKTARDNDNVCDSCLAGMRKMSWPGVKDDIPACVPDNKTLRDDIAMFVLPEVLRQICVLYGDDVVSVKVKEGAARQAYLLADEMLRRRNIKSGDGS